MRRDYRNVAILWFILTFLAELLLPYWDIFPLAAAEEATLSDESFYLLMVLGAPVFTFVMAVMAYSLIYFRAQGNIPEPGAPIHGNTTFSLVWLGITGGLCITVIIHPGLTGLAKFQGNRNADLVVQVTGRQWAWDVAYPAYNVRNVPEIALPLGKRVKFEITSADVVHSLWIPAFRHKMDAVPGRVTEMYVTPTWLGSTEDDINLRAQCAELCGLNHAPMMLPMRILAPEAFDAWLAEHAAAGDAITRGAAVAQAKGCAACHSTDGKVLVGPSWLDLFGHEVTLADGTTITADEAYLRESIMNPEAKIVQGFNPGLMPQTISDSLTEEEINDLIAYIQSLAGNKGQ